MRAGVTYAADGEKARIFPLEFSEMDANGETRCWYFYRGVSEI
jgi:hypothetical protein